LEKHRQKEILEERFGRILGMTAKAQKYFLSKKLIENGYDINSDQVILLIQLWFEEGLNQQQIADFICRDKASTTRFIDALEQRGLVNRIHDKNDRRQNIIKLTNAGEKKCTKLIGFIEKLQDKILSDIDPDHIKICKDVLKKVQRNISPH
jgi:DNA-binding MarR family transcriptional regulator